MHQITKQSIMDKKSISQELVQLIKQQIIGGELNPGDRIVETKVAKELGISQTPVREAIRHLSGEGVVTIVPNKGPIVRSLEAKDIFEIYSLRASLEGMAMRLVAQKATEPQLARISSLHADMGRKLADPLVDSLLQDSLQLHQTIIYYSDHSRLLQTYEFISFQIELVNRILGLTSTKKKEFDDHLELIEALKTRNPDYAEEVMKKHIFRSFRECMAVLQRDVDVDQNVF